MIYFNQKPFNPKSSDEAEQCAKVKHFQEEFPAEGLWSEYDGPAKFKELARTHLASIIRDLALATTAEPVVGSDIAPEPEEPTPVEDQANARGAEEHLIVRVIHKALHGDLAEATEVFEAMQQTVQDEETRRDNECFFEFLKFRRGESDSLARLISMEKQADYRPSASNHLGAAFESVNDFRQALEHFAIAASAAKNPNDLGNAICGAARCTARLSGVNDAVSKAAELLDGKGSSEAEASVARQLAILCAEGGDHVAEAVFLARTLSERPNDKDLIFKVAHALSEGGMTTLSYHYYDIYLGFAPECGAGNNNSGVQATALGLTFDAVEHYKKAIESGETLGAANLADMYIRAGMADEARMVIDTARKAERVHENVGASDSALANAVRIQSDQRKAILETGLKQQAFFRELAGSFVRAGSAKDLIGNWEDGQGGVLEILPDGTGLQLRWIESGVVRMCEGLQTNRGLRLSGYSARYLSAGSPLFNYASAKYKQGYAYIASEDESLHVLHLEESEQVELTYQRTNHQLVIPDESNSAGYAAAPLPMTAAGINTLLSKYGVQN